jgi:hypothetical protein
MISMAEVSGVGCQVSGVNKSKVSGVSPAAGLKSLPASVWAARLIEEETLVMSSYMV